MQRDVYTQISMYSFAQMIAFDKIQQMVQILEDIAIDRKTHLKTQKFCADNLCYTLYEIIEEDWQNPIRIE